MRRVWAYPQPGVGCLELQPDNAQPEVVYDWRHISWRLILGVAVLKLISAQRPVAWLGLRTRAQLSSQADCTLTTPLNSGSSAGTKGELALSHTACPPLVHRNRLQGSRPQAANTPVRQCYRPAANHHDVDLSFCTPGFDPPFAWVRSVAHL